MAPPLEIKLDIALDPVDGKPASRYFPGDEIHGKLYFTSNQSCTIRNFRLVWTGSIQVQPIQSNLDTRTYFDECWKFSAITKPNTKKSNIYLSNMVSANASAQESKLDLQKNKTVGLSFKVLVPNDQPLPSCTEAGALPNKIVYLLKAYLEENGKQQLRSYTQLNVPVYEYIFSRTPDMLQPRRVEQVFIVSNDRAEFTSAMRVTLPFRGSQPGTELPISITIWNNMIFSRKQGISISLLRTTEVLANGRAYASQAEKVHRIVTDLNITTDDPEQNQKVQTLRIRFPIPKRITPTISFESSQLLQLNYFIRVQAFAQEGVYTTSEGTRSQFMMLELPLVICTKSSRPDGSLSPVSSPTLSFTRMPSSNQSGIFRTLSNGSSSTTSDKMSASFSTLKLYSHQQQQQQQQHDQSQVSPVVVMTSRSVNNEDSRTVSSFHSSLHENSLLGVATSLSRQSSNASRGRVSEIDKNEDRQSIHHQAVTDEIDGHINDIINNFSNKTSKEKPPTEPKKEEEEKEKGGGRVFQMFDDDDSDEDEEEIINSLQVSKAEEKLTDHRIKPHQSPDKPHTKEEFVHKPNTLDDVFDSFDETEEEEDADESDLLGVLARHEKRGNLKIA